jgi:hypothetical protein
VGSASLTSWGAAEATVTRIATGHGRDVFVDALDLATHFLTKTLPKVAAEMALSVLAYNLTRVINIMGIMPLIALIPT